MFFDDKERSDSRKRLPGESKYEYLNQSGRQPATIIRNIIETFLLKYPEKERLKLIADLKSKKDETFLAAFFELYLYNLMLCLGAKIIIHPTLKSGEKPDFLILFPNGCEFYLEAKLIYQSPLMSKNEKLLTQLKAEIDKAFNGTRYNLHMQAVQGEMDNSLSFSKIAQDLLSWVQTLHRKKTIRVQYKKSKPPKKIIANQKWSIEIEAFMLRKGKTVQESAIPLVFFDPSGDNDPYKIISQKVKHYRTIDKPFILAVNDTSMWSINEREISRLLFNKNGLFTKPNCQHTRLSAILYCGDLRPDNCDKKDLVLIHHPWAVNELSISPLQKLTHWKMIGQKMKKFCGEFPPAILNLQEIEHD